MLLGANRVGLGPVGGPAATAPADFERGLAEKVAKLRREVSALHDDALEELRAENESLRSRLSLLEAGGSRHGASDKSTAPASTPAWPAGTAAAWPSAAISMRKAARETMMLRILQ